MSRCWWIRALSTGIEDACMSQSSPASSDSRRKFLLLSGGTVASAVLGVPAVHTSSAQKETRLGIGIIGCGGIMHHHVKGLVGRNEDVEIPFLCDVDPGQINRIKGHVRQGFQKTPPTITGKYEEVIRNPNVDAVIIATPHHWHAPIALQAMAEGKDVYIEKPISHVHREGQMIVDAARKYRRVVQQGSQMRSSPVTARAGKLLRDGLIGEVRVARAWTAETRKLVF